MVLCDLVGKGVVLKRTFSGLRDDSRSGCQSIRLRCRVKSFSGIPHPDGQTTRLTMIIVRTSI